MLKESFAIGTMALHNRLVMPPMAVYKCGTDGRVTDELLASYDERTRGGHIGLVIVEHTCVCAQGRAMPRQISAADDAAVEGLRRIAELLRRNGSRSVLQLSHAGAFTSREITGEEPVAPSAVSAGEKYPDPPRALTRGEIAQIEDAFVRAALRARDAGFDGVEIHAAHAYLLNQFYSPLTNRREDEYGPQSLENRLRIHTETLRAVRAAVGADYPVLLRFGGCDYRDGGSTIEDAAAGAPLLAAAGADAIDLSGGLCRYTREGHAEAGYFQDMSRAVKASVSVPVILTGGVKTAAQAEALLRAGCADLIGVGRALLADPRWAEKELG